MNKQMGEIAYLKMMIAASLHSVPAKEGELFERDFLKGKDQYILGKLIDQMLSDGWIYESKGHTLY